MDFEYHINRHREQVSKGLKLARNVLVIVLIALFLEVFLFNINHYRSSGYETISLDDELAFTETKGESYRITAANHLFEIHDLNKEVKNIHIEFDQAQPAQVVPIQINFTDSAHESYFYDTEFTAGIPLVDVSTNNWQSQYIYLETTGYVDDLRIDFGDSETLYPLVLKSLTINAPEPFFFNNLRFMLVLGVLLLIYCFRPKSAIYRIFIVKHERKTKAGIIATMLVEIALVSSFILMGSNLVGVATSSYNSGSWDGKSPVTFFEVGGDNAQQYAELAKSMTRGELYLEEEPPEWLVKMDNPYDKSARDEFQKATGEEPLFDVAYYNGHYYVYFGVLPVLIFYLPFYLVTGANFPTAIGVLICCILFIAGCTALLHRFARFHFKRVSLGLFLLLQIPLIFCSGMLYLAKFPTFYSLPIIMALALVVWGLYFWMRGRTSKRAGKWYLVGSLCMALVVACRPQFLVFSLLAFPLFWRKFITSRYITTRKGMREFACLVLPYVIVALGVMAYNYARFGSPTNFGANYNLTLNDMTQRGTVFGRFFPALFAYFLQTPSTDATFPWLLPTPFDTTYIGQTVKEVTFGGIFLCLPVLWVLFFSKRLLSFRIRQHETRTVAGVILLMIVAGFVVALLDAQMAGILQRYYADFTFLFLAAVVLLCFIANEAIDHRSATYKVCQHVLMALVAISLFYSMLMCFVPETGWLSEAYPWAYHNLVEMVVFWS